jgi:hypothetical protein
MDSSVLRYDFSPIASFEKTDEGYLRVWCRAARVGTQVYRRSDGTQVREYRPEDEVASPDSLGTFGMKPVTWTHPPVLLDAKNTKQFQVGYSGSQVRYTDGFVEVALTITDETAISRIERRDATEVSAGYRVDFDPTPGVTPQGEAYDGVQRNIRVNHIAIVPQGRAGPEVRLLLDRMDASDAVAWGGSDIATPNEVKPMATIKLDGLEVELPADVAGAVQSHLMDIKRRSAELESQIQTLQGRTDSLQAELAETTTERDSANGRNDAMSEYIAELEQKVRDLEEGRTDAASLDEAVNRRIALMQHVWPVVGDEFKFDGLSEREIYEAAFQQLFEGRETTDMADDYLKGLVDGAIALHTTNEPTQADEEPRADSTDSLKAVLSNVSSQSATSPVSSYRQTLMDAWKQPLTANR